MKRNLKLGKVNLGASLEERSDWFGSLQSRWKLVYVSAWKFPKQLWLQSQACEQVTRNFWQFQVFYW